MTNETFKDIEKLESDLWEAADNLRANSKLTSSDYFMPVLGVIFLCHAVPRASVLDNSLVHPYSSSRRKRAFIFPIPVWNYLRLAINRIWICAYFSF